MKSASSTAGITAPAESAMFPDTSQEQYSLSNMADRQSEIESEVIGMSIRYPGQYRGTQCIHKLIGKTYFQ